MAAEESEQCLRFRGKKSSAPQDKPDKSDDKPPELERVDLRRSFWMTRVVFLRSLSFIYFVAFLISFDQNKELIGDRGLLPVKLYLQDVQNNFKDLTRVQLFFQAPTLYWFLDSWEEMDKALDITAMTGMALSLLVFVLGSANMVIMFSLWMLYHSIVNVGQTWFSFGWESQLLETGFLAIWIVPVLSLAKFPDGTRPNFLAIMGYRWLISRIMLGAGLIKIRGDKCWLDLTCMNYFYETQPNPNPISYFAHPAPEAWHKFETFGNHMIELVFPFLTFIPFRWAALTNGFWQIVFQLMLISTGNLSFLNWLTVLPSIWFFDDQIWKGIFGEESVKKVRQLERNRNIKSISAWSRFSSNARLCASIVVGNLLSSRQIMNTSFEPFRIVNTYGAFGSVTKERTEIILEGTHATDPKDPNAEWLEYDFKCKPGNLEQTPCLISPYHYRLDWLMWFAAFQNYQHNPWLVHLAGKMLVNDPIVDSLILRNPFSMKNPPRFIRARHFKYNFSKPWSEASEKGQWWTRKYLKEYMPIVDLGTLAPIFNQFGWELQQQ